ncbi:MAG: hypothetical protein MI717_14225 [Spirochaetales bacterium]|nr:hypothetical protein [Spirochaetales bacterium]
MKLTPQGIPLEFLRQLPEGIKLVSRHGHPFLVMEQVEDQSGNSLMDDSVRIHGEPSVRLHVRMGESEGDLYVDSYWGSHAKLYSFLPQNGEGVVVEAFSPVDGNSLMVPWKCPIQGCGEEQGIRLMLPGGRNSITVCGKLGCPGHHIDVQRVPDGVNESLSNINFFGEGDEDFFSSLD